MGEVLQAVVVVRLLADLTEEVLECRCRPIHLAWGRRWRACP